MYDQKHATDQKRERFHDLSEAEQRQTNGGLIGILLPAHGTSVGNGRSYFRNLWSRYLGH